MNSLLEKEFYLTIVRHGQTSANELKRIQGHLNTPLTQLGIEQASSLGEFFKTSGPNKFHRVYTSDLGRAKETCDIILSYLDVEQQENQLVGLGLTNSGSKPSSATVSIIIKEDSRLRERKYGNNFEGKPIDCLLTEARAHGFDGQNFTKYTPDGAESMEQVRERLNYFIGNVMLKECQHNEEVLIVSHWGTIKELLRLFQPLADNSIKGHHLLESPNTAFCRFKIRYKSSFDDYVQQQQKARIDTLETTGISMITDSRLEDRQASGLQNSLVGIQTISLHQTPHLQSNKISVNMRQQVE